MAEACVTGLDTLGQPPPQRPAGQVLALVGTLVAHAALLPLWGRLRARQPQARTELVETALTPKHDRAALSVRVTAFNRSEENLTAVISGAVERARFSALVDLEAGERRELTFSPNIVPDLNLRNPRLWWPAQYGEPHLYDLALVCILVLAYS